MWEIKASKKHDLAFYSQTISTSLVHGGFFLRLCRQVYFFTAGQSSVRKGEAGKPALFARLYSGQSFQA
jgi:hypothetical protein